MEKNNRTKYSKKKRANYKLDIANLNTIRADANKLITKEHILGFAEAESSFSIGLSNSRPTKDPFYARLVFSIPQKSREILDKIRDFLGVGTVYYVQQRNAYVYSVTNFEELKTSIIPFFNQNKLIGPKKCDFEIFSYIATILPVAQLMSEQVGFSPFQKREIIEAAYNINSQGKDRLLNKEEQLIEVGVAKLPATKVVFEIKEKFENYLKTDYNVLILHPDYVSGFWNGDGGISISLGEKKDSRFVVTLSCTDSDATVVQKVKLFFDDLLDQSKGNVYDYVTKHRYQVTLNLHNAFSVFIPFFLEYPPRGVRSEIINQYIEYCTILEENDNKMTDEKLKAQVREKFYNMNTDGNRRRSDSLEETISLEDILEVIDT